LRLALVKYLDYHEARTHLEVGDWLKASSYVAMRKMLLAALGLSAHAEMSPCRDTGLNLDGPLPGREALENFVRYWHAMPCGVTSSRTVRNWLGEARRFFAWCADRDYGFTFPTDVARLFTAGDVETPAEPFDPKRLNKILAHGKARGRHRLKIYTLLGLTNGYGQTDWSEINTGDYFVEEGQHYIHRFRSKESRWSGRTDRGGILSRGAASGGLARGGWLGALTSRGHNCLGVQRTLRSRRAAPHYPAGRAPLVVRDGTHRDHAPGACPSGRHPVP
jgi:hypothetical protein